MATKEELIQRWDSFLQKIESRFQESLQQAEEASMELLEETDYDYYKTMQSWTGMKSQIHDLITKIHETWDGKVRLAMEAANSDWIDESCKANQLSSQLHDQLIEFQTLLEGKLSQRFYDHAIQIAHQDFHCSQCQAKLKIIKNLFRSQYITCQYCNTVNTFTPETKFAQIGWNVVDNIAKINSLTEYHEQKQALWNLQEVRQEEQTEELWDIYYQAYIKYYEKYFSERCRLDSSAEERKEADMQRKQTEFENYKAIHVKK